MIRDELIKLTNCAITGKKCNDFSESIERVAKEQNISSFLYQVTGNPLYKKYYTASLLKNTLYNEDVSSLLQSFEENSIRYVLMKGYYLKRLYIKEEMRVMGDVDILVFNEDFDKASDLMIENGFFEGAPECEHHKEYGNGRIKIELHKKLFSKSDYINGLKFVDWKEHLVKDTACGYHLEDSYHLLYIIAHYIKHLRSGTGIRPIIDIYLLYTKGNINEEWLMKMLKQAKLLKFWNTLTSAFYVLFDYDIKSPNVDVVYDLIDFSILNWMNGRNPSVDSKDNMTKYESGRRIKFIFNRVFPSTATIKKLFPFTKYKILLPLGYLLNLFRLVFTKLGRLIKLFTTKSKNSIYRKVGI